MIQEIANIVNERTKEITNYRIKKDLGLSIPTIKAIKGENDIGYKFKDLCILLKYLGFKEIKIDNITIKL